MIRQPANMLIGSALLIFIGGMALIAMVWTPYDPAAIKLISRLKPPSAQFWLGTDEFGRDVVSRLMAGAVQSMTVAILTVAFAIIVGTISGLVAGYTRGTVDRILMVFSDALLAFPGTLLALGIAFAPSVLRVVRASVLSAREREYVEASRVIGNSEFATMFHHVLPNCTAPIVVLATSMFGWVVLAESGLSFLGLGVPPPAPTWGNMLSAARTYIERAPWLGLAPGICISLTLLGINLLGDALRDRFDPRMEQM